MNHQPSRFLWMTSTMTPLSKPSSSWLELLKDWTVIYLSATDKRGKREHNVHCPATRYNLHRHTNAMRRKNIIQIYCKFERVAILCVCTVPSIIWTLTATFFKNKTNYTELKKKKSNHVAPFSQNKLFWVIPFIH